MLSLRQSNERGRFYNPEDFEDFKDKGTRNVPAFVSISPTGDLAFSSGAVRDYKLDRFQYAVLGYSQNQNAIRIKFHNTKDVEGNYGFFHRGAMMIIVCRSFFSSYGLFTESLEGRYDVESVNRDNSVFVVYLDKQGK